MADDDKMARHTFTRVTKKGTLELVDEDTGEIVATQKGYNLDQENLPYTDQVGDIICQRIAEGETMRTICQDSNMPSYGQITRWRRKHSEFNDMLKMARSDRAEFYHDQLIHAAESTKTKDEAVVQRVKVDAYKWAAEKGNPDAYGARTKISGDKNAPLQLIIDTGVPESNHNKVRDVEPVKIPVKIPEKKGNDE